MSITIYFNPRCSKCRKTLELVRGAGLEPTIVEYLDAPPSAARIIELAAFSGVPVKDLLRRDDTAFKAPRDVPDPDDDEALAAWLAANPEVLVRPIVVDEEARRAIIARPPENVRLLLPA